ncbi:MAG: hypothetical protein ABH914_00340, partial [Candidatus Omnitrophota bacterium]
MNPEHKKYILENIDNKSIKKIAGELNLKERKIKRYIKQCREKRNYIDPAKGLKHPVSKKGLFLFLILIIVLGFIAYGNSLNGQFLWDDNYFIKDNIYVQGWSHIINIFTEDVGAGAGATYYFYRPLQIFSYVIDYSFWKLNPAGYHITNILLHILTALCVYWLISVLFNNTSISFFTSILFLVHPIHTEAVTYISGRGDSLTAIFMLLCLIFYIKHSQIKFTKPAPSNNNIIYFLVLSTYILAVLSKENSVILPALILLYHYTFKKKINIKAFAPILIITSIYIVFKVMVLKSALAQSTQKASLSIMLQRFPGFFVSITNYIKLLFLPLGLHADYGSKMFAFSNPKAIIGIGILLFLLLFALRKRDSNKLAFFAISWFFIALLPTTNIHSFGFELAFYMAEHW